MKRKAALSIITAAFLIGVAACGNGNINSSGAAASNENSALQQSDAAENSTRKTSATEENADTEDASTENNADSNTDTEESAQNGTGTENTISLAYFFRYFSICCSVRDVKSSSPIPTTKRCRRQCHTALRIHLSWHGS